MEQELILMQIAHLWMLATGNHYAVIGADPIEQLEVIEQVLKQALQIRS